MSNQARNIVYFLFNYSGEALDVVSRTAGIVLLSGEAVNVGQPLHLRAQEFTTIRS